MSITELLKTSYTAFHAVENAEKLLKESGFVKIPRGENFRLEKGGKYYLVERESALVAFTVGDTEGGNFYYKFVCSHADSPCFKIKHSAENLSGKYSRLEVESYGGGIWYSWFDRKLRLAGRLTVKSGKKVFARLCASEENFVIPSLAVHLNREVNKNFAVNVQSDTQPLFALASKVGGLETLMKKFLAEGEELVDYDLFLVSADEPFVSGANGEFLTAARADDLVCAFSSVEAICGVKPDKGINVCAVFDSEEIGSETNQGAGSNLLKRTAERIAFALGKGKEDFYAALERSFAVSADNAHAAHPNKAELAPLNKIYLGDGVIVKHHANRNYTTDGFTSGVFKTLLDNNGIRHADFHMRSDMPCGGTLGKISLGEISVDTVDIGVAQLAMHSAAETFALADYDEMKKALSAFYGCRMESTDGQIELK